MRRFRWSIALLMACLCAPEAWGQGLLVGSPYGGYVSGGSLNIGFGRRWGKRKGLSVSLGVYRRGYVVEPFAPACYGRTQVTVIYTTPSPVYVLPSRDPLDDPLPDDRPRRLRRVEPEDEDDLPPPPPPKPKPKPVQLPPPKKEEPKPLPPPKEEAPKPPAKPRPKPPELPHPRDPEADPAAEYERLLDLGREAFARREYGRAVLRFRQASRVAPRQPMAHFLLAQALLALGKYHAASDAIHAGMALKPDWPRTPFQPLELYGANVAEYSEHLATLEATLRRHPNDPVLLFLVAYQLWFDGRKEEARPLLRRALKGAADADVIDAFLRALPPGPEL
jgi:hypothetical protein